jgi:hypothetical protein
MRDYVEIGPCPHDEEAAQLGQPDFDAKNIAECRQFIRAIRIKCGEPPEGAELRMKSNPHDFGVYREAAVYFDTNNEEAAAYAYRCEDEAPATWKECGLEAPVASAGRAR